MILCLGTTPTVQRTMSFARLAIDDVNRAVDVSEYASGKSVNAARVLHALGVEVLATGFLGGDTGKFMRGDLDRAGIAHDFLEVTAPTRLCITLLDQQAGTATELIQEPGAVEARAYARLIHEFDANLWRTKAVVLSGSLPPGAPVDFYADCVRRANEQSVPVILDARGKPLLAALGFKPYLVKPNREELANTVGLPIDSEDSLRAAMRRMIAMGARWVAVTRGKEGVTLCEGEKFWSLQAPGVQVVSAIGSGDSFAAGLAAGIAEGEDVPQACALATACGSANAMTSRAGHVNAGDVKDLLEKIRIDEL
jgi:tagatose 6-phosphate kinase